MAALSSGTRLGPYEVVEAIGAGGMGKVYRARDTKLGRDVAIKVLPEDFSADAEWFARFRREAQVLASLNHPNIAAIYGTEENALILELVEGPRSPSASAKGRSLSTKPSRSRVRLPKPSQAIAGRVARRIGG